ncbi:hypothetical protein ABT282_36140 [Streptomyces sp. NPDC000927]|uniref:hypothetical protein n=1 Tax=Streptomyces sp. NPDC000927 TaxID=3154371 RepID=UPI00331D884F
MHGSIGTTTNRVTLTAPRGYNPCELAGSLADVRFSDHGPQTQLTAGRHGDQCTPGDLRPRPFDIQVPNDARHVSEDEPPFTLQAPDRQTSRTYFAQGRLKVAIGTLIGPLQQGA